VLGLAGLLAILGIVFALPLRAEDRPPRDGPSAVSQLTAEEVAILRRKVPDWDRMDPRRRERIAKTVLRLRNLSDEERETFLRRIQEVKDRGQQARPHGGREHWQRRAGLMRALSSVMWSDLPEDVRTRITETLDGRARMGLGKAFYARFWARVVEARAAEGLPEVVLPPDAPEDLVQRMEQARVRAEAGDRRALAMLVGRALDHETRELTSGLGPEADAATYQEAGERLREEFSEAYQETLREVLTVLEQPERIASFIRRGPGPGHDVPLGPTAKARVRELIQSIRETLPHLEQHPRMRAQLMRLMNELQRTVDGEGRPNGRPEGRPGRNGRPRPGDGPRRGPGRGPRDDRRGGGDDGGN
jgi:hypothetical protein